MGLFALNGRTQAYATFVGHIVSRSQDGSANHCIEKLWRSQTISMRNYGIFVQTSGDLYDPFLNVRTKWKLVCHSTSKKNPSHCPEFSNGRMEILVF